MNKTELVSSVAAQAELTKDDAKKWWMHYLKRSRLHLLKKRKSN